jgi:uncharacterized protein
MKLERSGAGLAVGGGLVMVGGIAFGWVALAVGALAALALGLAVLALEGRRARAGRFADIALAVAALGIAGFITAVVAIGLHPAMPAAGLLLLALVLVSVPAAGVGAVLVGAAGIRQIAVARRVRRGLAAVVAALLLFGLTGYTGYVAAIGSDQLLHPTGNTDCRTPTVQYGWTYEAINYPKADDATLAAANPDMSKCSSQGVTAGDEVVTSDGVRIAGWYVPAASGAGPSAATVVLVHGWGANKSEVLRYAVPFHPRYNVVAIDLRAGGRSGGTESAFGLREKLDLEAILDWLVRTKHPAHVAVMGNSMGGGTAALAAATDPRIEALILDSMHAHTVHIFERRLDVEAGHPAEPGAVAILAGAWTRTGLDLTQADPINAIPALGKRPLLLLHGAADVNDVPSQSVDEVFQQALDAGVPVERHFCPGATHGRVIDTCPTEWGQWATTFLDRAFAGTN